MKQIKELYNKLKERNLLFLLIPFGLLFTMIILIIIFSFSSPASQNQPQNKTNNSSPKLSETLSINTVSPQNSTSNVGIFYPIQITFITPVPVSERTALKLSFAPAATGTVEWSSDNKTLTFAPSQLSNGQVYTATIAYKGGLYSWQFTTVSIENTSQDDQEKAQTIADENYNKLEKNIDQTYPWLDKLPLETDTYYFYFDIDKKSFVGQLYPSNSSDSSQEDQIAAMKSEIITSLTNLGIPTTLPFDWQIIPQESTDHE